MTAACECLAMWLDSEPCICNEPIGAPMEVSAKKLAQANRLVSHIQEMDRAIKNIAGKHHCRTLVWHEHDSRVELHIPPDIAAGLIRTMRFHALVELSKTGVTTSIYGHRPVVSA